mmetsp:Transcript_37947/g.80679  ORF Transcript_37947/g.80679 Transcript_37947/m.80679 type:complete len:273 (-) Transcript_37947:929-1747(-)
MASISSTGKKRSIGTAKSVASQTLAETWRVVFPVLSPVTQALLLPEAPLLPPELPSDCCAAEVLPGFPNSGRGAAVAATPRNFPVEVAPRALLPQSRLSRSARSGVGCCSGHAVSTSEASDMVSTLCRRSKAAASVVRSSRDGSDQPLHCLLICGVVSSPKASRNSGRQASAGSGHPKYSWNVIMLPREPFFFTSMPMVPRKSKRIAFQPLTSQGPTVEPSHDVASATSNLSTCTSHCMASAATRSSTTAPDSSASRACVTSTTERLAWFSM